MTGPLISGAAQRLALHSPSLPASARAARETYLP